MNLSNFVHELVVIAGVLTGVSAGAAITWVLMRLQRCQLTTAEIVVLHRLILALVASSAALMLVLAAL